MSKRKIDQDFINVLFEITITIHEDSWFKDKKRTRDEVQNWVAEKLAENGIYTVPVGASWGMLVSETFYKEQKCQKEK